MHSFQIDLPASVKREAVLALVSAAVRSIPVATKLAYEQAKRDGAVVDETDVRMAVLFLRTWSDAEFARMSGAPSNAVTSNVVSQ